MGDGAVRGRSLATAAMVLGVLGFGFSCRGRRSGASVRSVETRELSAARDGESGLGAELFSGMFSSRKLFS